MNPPRNGLALVLPEPFTQHRRAIALAKLIASIGRTPPRADVKHYPGGHVWTRYPHEAVILRAKEALEI